MSKFRWWTVGHPGVPRASAGLHSVSGSTRFPGMLWLSTETDDRVYLVELASWLDSITSGLTGRGGFNIK